MKGIFLLEIKLFSMISYDVLVKLIIILKCFKIANC